MLMAGQDAAALFNALYDATNRRVLTYITSKCRTPADIRDIYQDTYMELYHVLTTRGAGYIRNGDAFVLRLARQQLSRYYSRMERRRQRLPSVSIEEAAECLPDLASGDMLEDRMDERDLIARIHAFLAQQPADVQKVFILHFEMEYTLSEIAALLSMGESNVKNKLYRTLAKMREQCGLETATHGRNES